MPIFSRRFSLWTRLYGRMLLEPTADVAVTPMVSEVVVPVLSADRILETPVISPVTAGDISAGGGVYVPFFTVPAGQEWGLISGKKGSTTGNTRVMISISGEELEVLVAGTADAVVNLRDYVLREDDSVGLLSTGNGADTSRNFQIGYNLVSLSL